MNATPVKRTPFIEFNRVAFVIGIMLLVLTLFMFPPAITDVIAGNKDWQVFAFSAFVTGFIGLMLVMITRGNWARRVTLKEGFVLTVASWLVMATVSAVPFLFLSQGLSLVDAWFEAVSGITTTGATILTGLDTLPPGILLWRSILQWIGGIGIVLMALIMLPFLRVGGMQLFQTESSDVSDKFVPRAGELMTMIATVYIILTALCGLAYNAAGMSAFDALNHAMTTIATGGFSTHDSSLAHFDNSIHWIAAVFMFASSLPLVLYVKSARTGSFSVWNDTQVIGFTRLVLTVILFLAVWHALNWPVTLQDSLRIVAFNVMSIISTTGYAVGDYTAWGPGAVGSFFLLMFLGGCTGSTTGGIKTYRIQVMMLVTRQYITRLMSPNRIVVPTYNGKRITGDIATSVLAYISIMFAFVIVFTLALTFFGLDFIDSVSGAASALANVGPALGPNIGPMGTYAVLPDGAKFLLACGMLLGRLEFFTVLVVFNRDFWR